MSMQVIASHAHSAEVKFALNWICCSSKAGIHLCAVLHKNSTTTKFKGVSYNRNLYSEKTFEPLKIVCKSQFSIKLFLHLNINLHTKTRSMLPPKSMQPNRCYLVMFCHYIQTPQVINFFIFKVSHWIDFAFKIVNFSMIISSLL